jgi:DNA polymerase V
MSYILHIDGDAFFAACEALRRRDLQGKAFVVGEDRGIVVAMSYEAKALGIDRSYPIYKLKVDFPHVPVVSSHFELYSQISDRCFAILKRFFSRVERCGIDECFVEVEERYNDSLEELLQSVQDVLRNELGISYSLGIGRTKTLAKLASKRSKPNGRSICRESDEDYFLETTPLEKIWGVGRALTPQLYLLGLRTAYDLVQIGGSGLTYAGFSIVLRHTRDELSGIQRIPFVTTTAECTETQKSYASTRSFTPFSNERSFVFSELSRNVEIVSARLQAEGVYTKHVRFFFNIVYSKSSTRRIYRDVLIPCATQSAVSILQALRVEKELLFDSRVRYKGTGITAYTATKEDLSKESIFESTITEIETSSKVSDAISNIRQQFGKNAIAIASSVLSIQKRKNIFLRREEKDPSEYGLPLPYLGEVS